MYLFFFIEPQLTNNAYFSKLCCFSVSVYIHNKSICYIDSVTIRPAYTTQTLCKLCFNVVFLFDNKYTTRGFNTFMCDNKGRHTVGDR